MSDVNKKRRRHRWISITVIGVILIGAYLVESRRRANLAEINARAKAKEHAAVPITTITARKGEVDVYLEGLGTVTPVYTVTVYARVQGQIMSVNYREGAIVHQGQSLIDIDPRPFQAVLTQAEGALLRDQALLRESKIDLARYKKAYAVRAIPKQQLDDQQQVVYQYQGLVQLDEGALQAAHVNLDYCHIISPIDGRVGLRLVDPGNMIQSNSTTPLVVIAQIRPITVIFTVAEDYIPQIQAQIQTLNSKPMEVVAFDRSQEKKLAAGTFLTLDNEVDPTTGTVKIKAVFPNEHDELFPNQFVNAKLLLTKQSDATVVETPAIQRNEKGTFVYVIQGNQTAVLQPVRVGTVSGNISAVTEGLKPGDVVASNGFDKLQNGAKVSVRNAGEIAGASGESQP